ncbi:histone-lysine N-methyltransferase 2C-like isoform X2 [Biomphalaria pfeifferi]|uniref:PHD finger protein 10 n=1 Tax=Biomphalaria pfeifferi TaxID=112525 RepID=A0AAD8BNQ1_BIOPF|nr:histone-lysine N-methyltransferase 2C-like isoform X2 [Biomphalaria pfeifferi]
MASFNVDQADFFLRSEKGNEGNLDQEAKTDVNEWDTESLLADPPSHQPESNVEMQEAVNSAMIQSTDSVFHLVSHSETASDIHVTPCDIKSSGEDDPLDKGKELDSSALKYVNEESDVEMSSVMIEEAELLNIDSSKKDTITSEIDDTSERALLADDDASNQLTRHLNEDMDISQTSSDVKEVSDFNFLKPNSFHSLGIGSKDSSANLANMESDVERELSDKDKIHPHLPEKVFNIDEETRMSLDQTPLESSFIYPSLPPKKLFQMDDTKDSDHSDVETKLSTITDTEDIRLSHTISVDDATKDSGASDSNIENPVIKKPRRSSKESLGFSLMEGIDAGKVFSAENVFEYQWPQDGGEWHLLQEQICEYLKVKSFKRKYPDLYRRICDKEEKDFLRDKGVVTETQSDLGLTALRSEEVYDLMMKDYNEKYKEYIAHLQEKQKKVIREKHKEYSAAKLDKSKIESYSKKATRCAAEFNASLMRDRKEERRAYFDLQTFTVHYPKHKYKTIDPKLTKVGAYPVSLIPGQYQEYYKKYPSEELNYLPVKTVLVDPPRLSSYVRPPPAGVVLVPSEKLKSKVAGSEGEDYDSSSAEEEDNGLEETIPNELLDNSKCIGTDELDTPTVKGEKKIKSALKKKVSKFLLSPERLKKVGKKSEIPIVDKVEETGTPEVEEKGANSASKMPNKIHGLEKCRICKKRSTKEERKAGKLVKCAQCGKIGHMSCLDLTEELVAVIRTYPWQCMECKTCIECLDPYDEDKMMFCDRCDRGYHTFCIGLSALPTGHWECTSCQGCPALAYKSEKKKLEQTLDVEAKLDEEVKLDLTQTPDNCLCVNDDIDDKTNVLTNPVFIKQDATTQDVTVKDVKLSDGITPPVKIERRGRKRKIVDPNAPPPEPKVTPAAQKLGARQSKRLKLKEEEEEERKKKEMEEKKMKRLKKKKKVAASDEGKDVVDEGVDDSLAILFDKNEEEEMADSMRKTEMTCPDNETASKETQQTCPDNVIVSLTETQVTCQENAVVSLTETQVTCQENAVVSLTETQVTCQENAVVSLIETLVTCQENAVVSLTETLVTCQENAVVSLTETLVTYQEDKKDESVSKDVLAGGSETQGSSLDKESTGNQQLACQNDTTASNSVANADLPTPQVATDTAPSQTQLADEDVGQTSSSRSNEGSSKTDLACRDIADNSLPTLSAGQSSSHLLENQSEMKSIVPGDVSSHVPSLLSGPCVPTPNILLSQPPPESQDDLEADVLILPSDVLFTEPKPEKTEQTDIQQDGSPSVSTCPTSAAQSADSVELHQLTESPVVVDQKPIDTTSNLDQNYDQEQDLINMSSDQMDEIVALIEPD